MSTNEPYVVEHAICTYCGCVCDDIVLTVEDHRITQAEHACPLGKAWFAAQKIEPLPSALIDGREATTEEGVEAAAQILAVSRFPLIYGLTHTTCEAQRQAIALADYLGATIDTPSSEYGGPPGTIFQGVGDSTATLGEIKNRADLVIYWGTDPDETHPRLSTRYAVTPKGMFVPNGKQDRTVLVIDVERTLSAREADLFIQVKPESDFELLWALRALIKGLPIDSAIEATTGVSLSTLQDVAERMKSCRYGVLFFGARLATNRGKQFNAGAVAALVSDLNQYTHFVAKPVWAYGNSTGANNVLSWQTGYPFAVNFSRGYPRFNPDEFSAAELLARGEADAALIIASHGTTNLSQAANEHLQRIPVVTLGVTTTATPSFARVAFTTATYGINTQGTVYRMDDVALALRPAFPSPYPNDEQVLGAIAARVRELLG